MNHSSSLPALSPSDEDDYSNSSSNGSSFLTRTNTTLNFSEIEEDFATVAPHEGYKKVLVTGGAGFIGSHVADFLLARGDDVVVIDELNDYYDVRIKEGNLKLLKDKYGKRVSIYRGDICDESLMEHIFAEEKPKWGK